MVQASSVFTVPLGGRAGNKAVPDRDRLSRARVKASRDWGVGGELAEGSRGSEWVGWGAV